MEINYEANGIIQIDDARIIWRNFSGIGSKYNREGDRNFALVIPDQVVAEDLVAGGWNVKIKPPREDGDDPFMVLPVKVKFNDRGPNCYLVTGSRRNRLYEDQISILDDVDIRTVNLDIRPYDWGPIGADNKCGRTAYLQAIEVVQAVDRFASRMAEEEYPEE